MMYSLFSDSATGGGIKSSSFRKIFWVVNIILSQFFFLILISYVGSEEHVLGVLGYRISLFLITHLLGITAFALPLGWFYLSFSLLKNKQNISAIIRHLIWFELSFFWFNILLLNTPLINTAWAGLLPKFFHAMVTRAFTDELVGIFYPLVFGFELFLFLTFTSLLTISYLNLSYKEIYTSVKKFLVFLNMKSILHLGRSFKKHILSILTKKTSNGSQMTIKEQWTYFWKEIAGCIERVNETQIEEYLGANIPSLNTSGVSLIRLDLFVNPGQNKNSSSISTPKPNSPPEPIDSYSETPTTSNNNNKSDEINDWVGGSNSSEVTPKFSMVNGESSEGEVIDLKLMNFFEKMNGKSEGISNHRLSNDSDIPVEELKSTANGIEIKSESDVVGKNKEEENAEETLFDDNSVIVPSVINTKGLSGRKCLAEAERLVFSKNPSRSKTLEIEIKNTCEKLENTIKEFGINTQVVSVSQGPVITQYELTLEPGVHINKIVNLSDNIALSLAAESVRIVAPIPGKAVIGIEIPNKNRDMVTLRDIVDRDIFRESSARLPIALGASVSGEPIITDLAATPHLLVAGATGSGKSVCVNSIICSLLLRRTPEQVRFLMIDPKMVELNIYKDIPHLLAPVITDPQKAALTLKWAISEMEARYRLLEKFGVRNISSYNQMVEAQEDFEYGTLPYIVIIIDEFADLMMVARKEIEDSVTRLAAMSRAIGIHLLLATQRPSVDVITGVIKANFPSRIAFQVSSKIDSRTIIDSMGAEKLLGKGDMLFQNAATGNPHRIQGTFLSDEEVREIVSDLKHRGETRYILNLNENLSASTDSNPEWNDDLFQQAVEMAKKEGKISTSLIQRRLRIGYNRAARIVELMEEKGMVGASDGVRPREVLVSNY